MRQNKWTTRTGRSLGPGKVTRASHLVRTRCRKQEAPLPAHMQVHPKALTPTSRHPQCFEFASSWAWSRHLRGLERGSLLRGVTLSRKPKQFSLYVQGKQRGYTDDIHHALGFKRAAEDRGWEARVIDER